MVRSMPFFRGRFGLAAPSRTAAGHPGTSAAARRAGAPAHILRTLGNGLAESLAEADAAADAIAGYLHHCFSHGMPSLLPSILVPGQFLRKYVASAQEVI